jgi:hypothetical protein
VTDLDDTDIQASYYCCAEVLRNRQRTGAPIPGWLHRHYTRMDTAFRLSQSRQESGCGTRQLKDEKLITAADAADILGWSKRQVQRKATDLDGEIIGGRWLFKLNVVLEYKEGMSSG